ncbi:MAG: glucosamine-6-phosphate deaminase [Isosphaeraceae bacterium]
MPTSAAPPRDLAGARIHLVSGPEEGARLATDRIVEAARVAIAARGRAVLGLATGKTPILVYERLSELHRAGSFSFRDVETFNLDEYYPISPFDPNSYRSYMHRHLFSKVDIAPDHAHVLDGTVPPAFAGDHCAEFDRWIAAAGGLDLQLLGIGRNGHIGFNEPSGLGLEEARSLPTRPVDLHPITRADALADFGGNADAVPMKALTMGVGPILAARSILVLAFGPAKAEAVASALLGPLTAAMPASLLQLAGDSVTWILDAAAAEGLDLGGRGHGA